MDRHLRDLNWSNLRILSRKDHEALTLAANAEISFLRARGMDHVDSWDGRTLRTAVSYLERKWRGEARLSPFASRLLVIERGEPDPFYLSDAAEIRGAGNLRRSIPNMREVLSCAERSVGSAFAVQLEQMPLRRQYEYFRGAEAVLYQHGAAMANLVFCKRGATVFEILPQSIAPEVKDMARELCMLLGLRYVRVHQDSEHSPVDVEGVRMALESAMPSA